MMEEDGVMKSQRRVMKAGDDDVSRRGSTSGQVVFGPSSCPSLVGLGGALPRQLVPRAVACFWCLCHVFDVALNGHKNRAL